MDQKIYRSSSDYIIAGVCGGLGRYFDIDPTLVRLIFILLAIAGGSGLIIYIILAIIIPKEAEGKAMALGRPRRNKVMAEDVGDRIKNAVEDVRDEVRDRVDRDRGAFSQDRYRYHRGGRGWFGFILLAVGALLLWNQIMPYYIKPELVWPAVLIILGLWILLR